MTEATELFALADRELWLVTAQHGGNRGGLIATFVCHASLPPELPRVLIAVAKQHHTWQLIEQSGAFALHLLREDQVDFVWRFGLQSRRDVDKLAGLATQATATGSPRLLDMIGWADCRVEARWDTGDRTVYLAEIVEARLENKAAPLTVHGLLRIAPRDKLEQLRALREQDSRIDAAAILAWRKDHGGTAGEA